MLRILFFSASPHTASALDLTGEFRALEDRLRTDGYSACVELRHIPSGTFDLIEHELRGFRPNVLHFAGHGNASGLLIEGTQGQGVLMPSGALGRLLELLKAELRCLVLNACHSAKQASSLLTQVPCVIGMQDAVKDPAALRFSTSFYAALAAGDPIRTAFDLAKNGIYGIGRQDAEVPGLVHRPRADQLPLRLKTKIFCLHAPADREAYDSLRRSLAVYRRAGVIELTGPADAPATASSDRFSEDQLGAADVILCLASPDYVDDDLCIELTRRALRRREAQQAVVIGLLLRSCAWRETPLGHLQPLPRSGMVLANANRDAWWTEVGQEIIQVVRAREEEKLQALWRTTLQAAAPVPSPTAAPAPSPQAPAAGHTASGPDPARSPKALRELLQAVLRTASDFEAFCLDYFPHVKQQFVSGQTRTDRESILLELVTPAEILTHLAEYPGYPKHKTS